MSRPTFDYRHTVTFEETNAVGNVYFAHYLHWQGRCRELFLHEHAPGVLEDLRAQRRYLVTTRCSCEFFQELMPFDEVVVRMSVREAVQNRLALRFEYLRESAGTPPVLVARGEQQVAWLAPEEGRMVPVPVPPGLLAAIEAYTEGTGPPRPAPAAAPAAGISSG